jgi:proline iminopeptidase
MAQTYLHISAPSYQLSNELAANLYDDFQPIRTGHLKVSDTHQIWFEEYGNPNGIPVVLLHGGPGGAISPFERRCFDPKVYHIVAFDQRGAGKSVPAAEMKDNTPQHSIEDMEILRKHLGIDKWLVVGGSSRPLLRFYFKGHIPWYTR